MLRVIQGPTGLCLLLVPTPVDGPQPEVPYWLMSVKVPPCRLDAAAAKAARKVPAVDPVTLAVRYWTTIPLPTPKPSVPPGYAVTGKPSYLVTDGTLHPAPYIEATPLGLLTVKASGTYMVDWGDGTEPTWSGPYQQEGRPWPSGVITHTYDVAGSVQVTVTEDWTATWSLAGVTGTLGGLHTEAAIEGFRVEQLQAVITS